MKRVVRLAIILFFVIYAIVVYTWWQEGNENFDKQSSSAVELSQ